MLTQLTVEAARQKPTTAPQWWMRKSKNQQEQYLNKHPNSYLKAFLKKSDVVRKKKVKPAPPAKRKQSSIENKMTRIESQRSTRRVPSKKKAKAGKAAVHGERQRRDEERRLTESLHTGIRKSFIENLREIADKTSYIADEIKSKMSPASKRSLSDFVREKKAGVEPNEAGRKTANKVLLSVTHAVLGAALVASVMTGAAPLAGAITAAFLGIRDYRKSLEGTKHEGVDLTEDEDDVENDEATSDVEAEESSYDEGDEGDEELESTSAYDEEDSDLDELIQEFVDWLGNQDIDAITEKFAEYAAIEKMEKSGWSPSPSNMTDEELDDLESEADETQFTSESGLGPRVTFKLDSSLVRKQPELRNTFHVMCQDRKIGRIYTDDSFASKKKRIWKIELSDGFNESAYHSGRQDNAPFTIIKNGEVLLKNHYPSTFIECCNWVRSNIDKNYL